MIILKRKNLNTHLTLEARMYIEEELNKGVIIKNISNQLKRDSSVIIREIERNKQLLLPSLYASTSCCIHKDICKKRFDRCDNSCNNFELYICDQLKASPHICNGCTTKNGCRKAKYYYKAKEANTQYLDQLSKTRKNLHYTQIELDILNNDFYNLVINTKSIYHSLIVINSMGYNFNQKSIYRQIKDNKLRLKSSDLPRTNKRKEHINKTYKRDISGHTYEDYLSKRKEKPNIVEWQLDCVQGIQGKDEQVFLTLQLVPIKFLFIFPIKFQTNNCVCERLKEFVKILNSNEENKLIELLLTDNGHEFINLEKLMEAVGTDNIYYCHPYSSFEKGSIENNHELIRRIIPQGVSLTPYTQHDINLICSNINSLYRKELDNKCPFDLIHDYLSKEIIEKLGYKKVNPEDVKLMPELLGEKNISNIKKHLSSNEIKKANIKFIKRD